MPGRTINTICGFCSTGCCLSVTTPDGGEAVVRANPDYPVNRGTLCPKGFVSLEPLKASDRAKTPYMRNHRGRLEPVSWGTALQAFVDNFKRIQSQHGRDSVAFLGTGQMPIEEIAFLGALAKFGMGCLHGDGNTRQCMATAALAYKQSFGFDAPPFTYQDFEESDVLVFIGANPVIAHPTMWNRVRANPHDPTIVVVDPRRTETAKRATRHYPVEPGSLLTLLYGVAHILAERNWIDAEYITRHTRGFEGFRRHVRDYQPRRVSGATGLSEDQLLEFARIVHVGQRVSFWWTMGVNQSHQGVRTAQAIINLALMTGNVGRPGTGANSITGQCDAMGSRLFSNTSSLLGGHDFADPVHRRRIARVLGIDERRIPHQPGWAYDQIVEGIDSGVIKGLWVVCTNPLHSWVDKNRLERVLDKLEYLVVQDMYYTTDSVKRADLVLAAAGCGEKEGAFINSERRLGVIRKIAEPPGEAKTDFEIFRWIAEHWGCADLFEDWTSPAAVFQILKRTTQGQPCDITGIGDYDAIEKQGGIQWPYPESAADTRQERRLFENGRFFHEDGKARFFFERVHPVSEPTDGEYPFVLMTGRGTMVQWHTQTRTGKVPALRKGYPEDVYLEMNAVDAQHLSIADGDPVVVASRRGEVRATLAVADTVMCGHVFMPMHYPETNELTRPAFDPHSREPDYKYCAVRVAPATAVDRSPPSPIRILTGLR
jgi:assimilatory nitrate reductase catalytic subunit